MRTFKQILKKSRLIFPAIVLCSVASVFAQTTDKEPPPLAIEHHEKAWKTFAPPDAGFSILMPGEPVKSGRVIQSDLGPLPHFMFTLKTAMGEYMASYSDFPFAITEPKELRTAYDGSRDKMKQIASFTLSGERDFNIEGRVGRELIFESEQSTLKARLLIVNRRLFQAIILTRKYQDSPPPTARFYESTINKFLNSFKLTDIAVTNKQEVETGTALAQIEPGRFENATYINPSLGFRINFPTTWHVNEQTTSDSIGRLGRELAKGSNERLNDALDKSAATTIFLFTVSNVPYGTPTGVQAVLQCGLEKVKVPGLTNHAYMNNAKTLILGTTLGYKQTRDVDTQVIGGQSFSTFEAERPAGEIMVKQKYYAKVQKDLALFFIATYITEEDRLVLEKTMQSLKFGQ